MPKKTPHHVVIDGEDYARIYYYDYNREGKRVRKQKTRRVNSLHEIPEMVGELWAEVKKSQSQTTIDTQSTVSQYLDEWLSLTSEKRNEKTNSDYESFFRLYVKPAIGNLLLLKVGKMDVQRVYKAMTDRGLAPKTVRLVHGALSAAFKQAVEWEKLSKNPASGLVLPRSSHKEMLCLDSEQVKEFLRACKADRHALLFRLALYTGARPSEYLGLKWGDVDIDRKVIRFQRRVRHNRKGGGWNEDKTKTRQSTRSIPLSYELVDALIEHGVKQTERGLNTFVFASEAGTPLSIRNLERRHFKPILVKAELPDIRLYDLRHTCATLMLSKGVDIKSVSEWLGHANPNETLKTYAHVLPSMKERAANSIAEELRD